MSAPNISKCGKHLNIEAGQRILPSLPEKLAITAERELSSMGVTVYTSTVVSEVGKTQISTSDGRKITSTLTLWAAGVKGADYLSKLDGLETDKLSRLVVDEFLQTSLPGIGNMSLPILTLSRPQVVWSAGRFVLNKRHVFVLRRKADQNGPVCDGDKRMTLQLVNCWKVLGLKT